jgi:hypothetical protein
MSEQKPPHRRTPEEIAETSRLEYGSLDLSGMVGTSFPAILRLENYKSAPSHKANTTLQNGMTYMLPISIILRQLTYMTP